MPRGPKPGMSIVELEQLLSQRKSALQKLQKLRSVAQKKVDLIDREIAKLGGSGVARTAGGRARNSVSLVEAMTGVLKGKSPMKVGDILKAVLATGYQSSSPNFRGIVNQTLIKEKVFQQTDRGTYTVK